MEQYQTEKRRIMPSLYTGIQEKRIHIPFFCKCIFLFFFIFDIYFSSISSLPTWITSRRLILVIALLFSFFSGPQPQIFEHNAAINSLKFMTAFQLLLFTYAATILVTIGFGNGERLAIHIIKFLLIALLGAVAFSCVFTDLDELMQSLVIVMTVQALIIFLFIFNSTLQAIVDNLTGLKEFYTRLHEEKYYTGLACAAAPGALRMSLGLAACVYFITKKDGSLIYLIPFSLISIATIIIARTGFFLSALALFIMVIGIWNCSRKKFWKTILTALFVALFGICTVFISGLNEKMTELLPRLLRLFSEGLNDAFFKSYLNHPSSRFPDLSMDTMVGIGIISGIGGNGIEINIDGGYLRMYAAVGLPISIIFYTAMLFLLAKPIFSLHRVNFRYVMIFMLLYIFLGEFKEYFIYDNYGICFFYAIFLLYEKGNLSQEHNK